MSNASSDLRKYRTGFLVLGQDHGRGPLPAWLGDGTYPGGRTNGKPVFWSRDSSRPIRNLRKCRTGSLVLVTDHQETGFSASSLFDLNSEFYTQTRLQQQKERNFSRNLTSVFIISPTPPERVSAQSTFSICDSKIHTQNYEPPHTTIDS